MAHNVAQSETTEAAGFPTVSAAVPWFVALPDSAGCGGVAAKLAGRAPRSLPYPSGRPWLLGNWPDTGLSGATGLTSLTGLSADGLVATVAGKSRLALIGCCPVTPAHLTRLLESTRDVAALDVLASSLPGNFHIVAEIDGRRRIQGTASGVRRVFYTDLGGQVIASDRADLLAWLAGSRLDPTALALSLLDPFPPHPLDDRPMWREIEALPPDHFLLVGSDGRPSRIRWWRQPEPVLPLADGARLLTRALVEAVDARTAAGGTVSCDLSGGLDSTSVCFLAARSSASSLVAYTGIGRDPGDDDIEWAALAIGDLPRARHEVRHEILPRDELPLVYDGIMAAGERLDRPFIGVIHRVKLLTAFHRLMSHHPRVHLTGFGGDEVADGSSNYLPTLARTNPWTALDRFRGYRAQARWPLLASLWMFRPRSYRACLAGMAGQLAGARLQAASSNFPELDWDSPPQLPEWVTAEAVALVHDAFGAVLDDAHPLGGTRSRHADLLAIRSGAATARLFGQLMAPTGLPLAAPFLDDRVIEACLAVRPQDRVTPWEYKPLLKEAMRAIVPPRSLQRVTKAETSAEEEAGRRANLGSLLSLFADSRLAGLGLVDAQRLRAGCGDSPDPREPHNALQPTVASEVWLRVLAEGRATGGTRTWGRPGGRQEQVGWREEGC